MKSNKVIPFLLIVSASTMALSSGSHNGGHGHSAMDANNPHWLAPKSAAAEHNPIKMTRQSVATGNKIYQQNCASCHGTQADGNGMAGMMMNPRPADLQAMAGTHPDGDFAYKINTGRGAMPSWKSALEETQVWHLVNFIQSLDKIPFASQQQGHDHATGHGHDS